MQEDLKYMSSEKYYEGVITEIFGGAVTIDLKGRLGQFKIPNRMLISDCNLEIGQEVGFMLSSPEVLNPEPNEEYIKKMQGQKNIEEQKKFENLTRIEKDILLKKEELEKLKKQIEITEENL